MLPLRGREAMVDVSVGNGDGSDGPGSCKKKRDRSHRCGQRAAETGKRKPRNGRKGKRQDENVRRQAKKYESHVASAYLVNIVANHIPVEQQRLLAMRTLELDIVKSEQHFAHISKPTC